MNGVRWEYLVGPFVEVLMLLGGGLVLWGTLRQQFKDMSDWMKEHHSEAKERDGRIALIENNMVRITMAQEYSEKNIAHLTDLIAKITFGKVPGS